MSESVSIVVRILVGVGLRWILGKFGSEDRVPTARIKRVYDPDFGIVDLTNRVEHPNVAFSVRMRAPTSRTFYPESIEIYYQKRWPFWERALPGLLICESTLEEIPAGREREVNLRMGPARLAHALRYEVGIAKSKVSVRAVISDRMGKVIPSSSITLDIGEALGGRLLEEDEVRALER